MALFDRIKAAFAALSADEKPLALTPQPIAVGVRDNEPLLSHAARLYYLHTAVTHSADIAAEIESRKAAIAALGRTPPANTAEAEALYAELKG